MDYQLTEADNNKTITAAINDTVAIVLRANPSTGFKWRQVETTAGKLLEIDYDPLEPKRIGGGVNVKFVFTIQQAGISLLDYARAWENNPVKWFQVNVEIKS